MLPARFRYLLCLLALQLLGWVWLSRQLPQVDSPWTSWHNDKPLMLLEDQYYGSGRAWFGAVLFDLDKETWWEERDRYEARRLIAPDEPAFYWRVREHEDLDRNPTAELVNRQTGQVVKQRELAQLCEIVDNRFAVYGVSNHLFWLDLDDEQSTLHEVRGLVNAHWIYWHCWSGSTIVLQREVLNSRQNSITHWLDMVRFNDTGPQVIASWPAYTTPYFYHYLDTGDSVVSWDASGKTLEFRSKLDGQLVATETMPPGLNADASDWGLTSKVVHLNSVEGWLNYDLKNRDWIEVPKGARMIARAPGGDVCQLLETNRTSYFYDIATRTRLTLSSEPFTVPASWRMRDEDTSIAVVNCGLPQFHIYNHRNGQLIKTYAPFRLVPYALAILEVAFLAWSAWWMRRSLHRNAPAWIDVLLVVGLPTGFFLWRQVSTGCAWDGRRLSCAYTLGGTYALILLTVVWFVFGRVRWSIRVIPLLVTIAIAALIIDVVADYRYDPYWVQTVTLYTVILWTLVCLAVARWSGVELISATTSQTEPDWPKRVHLSDLFLLTLAVALIFVVTEPLPELAIIWSMNWPWLKACDLAMLQLICLWLAFGSNRWLFCLASILVGLLLLAALLEPFSRMLSAWRLERQFSQLSDNRMALAAAVATFLAAMPYRIRGYRLTFRRTAVSHKETAALS